MKLFSCVRASHFRDLYPFSSVPRTVQTNYETAPLIDYLKDTQTFNEDPSFLVLANRQPEAVRQVVLRGECCGDRRQEERGAVHRRRDWRGRHFGGRNGHSALRLHGHAVGALRLNSPLARLVRDQ